MNTINIDSLRIRIKSDYVKLKASALTDDYARLNLETGQITEEEEEKSKRLKIRKEGYRYDFSVRRFQFNGVTNCYLVMTLNAKMLRSGYFSGLTLDNLRQIYSDIQNLNVVEFSWETFMILSFATDIDFSLDYKASNEEYVTHLNNLIELTPFSRERDRGYKSYHGGLEWNSRSSADSSNPYIKTYDKAEELWSRSSQFAERFLNNEDIKDRKRFEFTIKDANHLSRFDFADTSLLSIVTSTQLQRIKMMRIVTGKVFDTDTAYLNDYTTEDQLKPDRVVLLQALRFMHESGYVDNNSIEWLTGPLNKSNRAKYRKKLMSLHKQFIQPMTVSKCKVKSNPITDIIFGG